MLVPGLLPVWKVGIGAAVRLLTFVDRGRLGIGAGRRFLLVKRTNLALDLAAGRTAL